MIFFFDRGHPIVLTMTIILLSISTQRDVLYQNYQSQSSYTHLSLQEPQEQNFKMLCQYLFQQTMPKTQLNPQLLKNKNTTYLSSRHTHSTKKYVNYEKKMKNKMLC